jgi:hypothetical protein
VRKRLGDSLCKFAFQGLKSHFPRANGGRCSSSPGNS